MPNELTDRFIAYQRGLAGRAYLVALILYLAAPTIAGGKPASLLNFGPDRRRLDRLWHDYRGDFRRELGRSYGLSFWEIPRRGGGTAVLFYHRLRLTAVLAEPENRLFLEELGYPVRLGVAACLERLKLRFRNETFPHEAGILLGIPAADVRGFIANRGRNFLLNGYWKVYQRPEAAAARFAGFDRARETVLRALADNAKRRTLPPNAPADPPKLPEEPPWPPADRPNGWVELAEAPDDRPNAATGLAKASEDLPKRSAAPRDTPAVPPDEIPGK